MTQSRPRLRWIGPFAIAALGLVSALALVATPDTATASPSPQPAIHNPRLGLVHVDVMDLHVVRLPDAPPEDRPVLPAADIADRYRRAAESGAGWHRWSAYWDLVERAGTDTWTVTDGMVARDAAHGLSTLMVLQGNQPGVRFQAGAPEGLDQPAFLDATGAGTDDPAQAARTNPANRWARFVGAVVDRYRPGGTFAQAQGASAGVRHWQIGNEPNLPGFWRGTPAEYARLLEVAALVAKWLDPGAIVVHAGIADDGNADEWYARFADALAARAATSPLPARYNYYFDKAAWHWYRSPSLLATGPDRARAILAERGLPVKPLWITELGVPVWSEHPGPCWDPSSPGRATTAEQAGFVWQALAEALAAGAENVFYFQLYDDCGNGAASYDAFGLVRNHAGNQCWAQPGHGCWSLNPSLAGTPRPAFQALQVAARELNGARRAAGAPSGTSWRSAVFQRPGAVVTVAWSLRAGEQTVILPARSGGATLYTLDPAGAVISRRMSPSGSGYNVSLPGITNHNGLGGRPILRGSPVMLVEEGAAAGALAPVPPSGANPPAAVAGAGQPPAPSAPDPALIATDTSPPVLALVREIPAISPPRIEVSVIAGDEESGVAAFSVYVARGLRPPRPEEWQPVIRDLPWTADSRAGVVSFPWEGKPGEVWYFAARARDAAGNWTAVPTFPQAATRFAMPATQSRPRPAGRNVAQ